MSNKTDLYLQYATNDISDCLNKGYNWHPITTEYERITNDNEMKLIDPIFISDNGKEKRITKIPCSKSEKNLVVEELTEKERKYKNIISVSCPLIGCGNRGFLFIFYNILSFDQALEWIAKNEHENIYTKLRIVNAAWGSFGKELEVPNHVLVNFYIQVIKTHWLKDIYYKIGKYIYVENDSIYLKENNLDLSDRKVERINFIIKKYANNQFVYDVLNNFIQNNDDLWTDITDFCFKIKTYYISAIMDLIGKTLKKIS